MSFADRLALFALPGGGRLAVLVNPHAPTVTLAGHLEAGVSRITDGRYSVAGLTAAMLDRGSERHDRIALARELEDHGLHVGVGTSTSSPTVVRMSGQGLAEQLPRLVGLLTEILRQPTFPEDELERLRTRVLGGLVREREETFANAFAALTRRLYPIGHPMHRRPVEVREAEVAAIRRGDLVEFHSEAYEPSSLTVAVVGDVEPQTVAAMLADHLEGWEGVGIPEPLLPAPADTAGGEELVHIPDRPNLDVLLGHAGRLRRGDPDEPGAVIGNACLGQSTLTSRLGRVLRDEQGLTYGIYSRFFGKLAVPGPWAIFLTVSPDALRKAEALCRRETERFLADGPSVDELQEERTAAAGAYRVALATNDGVARELASALASDEGLSRLDSYPEKLLRVSRAEVMAAVERHIHPERLVLAAAGSITPSSGE